MKENAKGLQVTRRRFLRLACLAGIGLSAPVLVSCSSKDQIIPLKLIGYRGYNYMNELHGSPNMRKMIKDDC